MGALLTRLYGVDQTTPYGFKFSGITLWLLAADAGIQNVIDNFNPNCPRWCDAASVDVPTLTPSTRRRSRRLAHSTLQYGMRLDESDARRRFARLKNAVEGSGPIMLRLTGPPDLYGPYGDVPVYQMRGIGLMFQGSQKYDELRDSIGQSFGTAGSSFPHTSLVYDWIGSPRVTHDVAEAIRAAVPELSYGAEVVFDGVALVDMRGRSVGEWEVLDRISLVEPGCDEPIAPTA